MDEIKQEEQSKICLVMMPFSDPTGYLADHFKRVYEYLIKPACKKAYEERLEAADKR